MSTITPDYLDQLQALCDAATPGEWHDDGRSVERIAELGVDDDGILCGVYTREYYNEDRNRQNTRFIAAARDAVPKLIAEVRRLQAEIDGHYCDACGC